MIEGCSSICASPPTSSQQQAEGGDSANKRGVLVLHQPPWLTACQHKMRWQIQIQIQIQILKGIQIQILFPHQSPFPNTLISNKNISKYFLSGMGLSISRGRWWSSQPTLFGCLDWHQTALVSRSQICMSLSIYPKCWWPNQPSPPSWEAWCTNGI